MNWRSFCRYTTVGQRNRQDVIKTFTPEQLELLKQSVIKELPEECEDRKQVLKLIDTKLTELLAYHG